MAFRQSRVEQLWDRSAAVHVDYLTTRRRAPDIPADSGPMGLTLLQFCKTVLRIIGPSLRPSSCEVAALFSNRPMILSSSPSS